MSSRFDSFRLVDLAEQTVRTSIKVASWSERQIFDAIRAGMGAATPPEPPPSVPEPPDSDVTESLDAKMHDLLDRAIGQNTAASRQELFHKILDRIVPEAAGLKAGAVAGADLLYALPAEALVG